MQPLRMVSLLPSATEIVHGLGLGSYLVGRSHECDYPATVARLPVCTAPKFTPEGSSRVIHDRVTELLQSALSVYQINTDVLATLQPTHILTQAQCEVCAVSLADVETAMASLIQARPQVISLQPHHLADIWDDLRRVAIALLGEAGTHQADTAIHPLQSRVAQCQQRVATVPHRPTVVCIEWPEPLMTAGNWVPELVELAGGKPLLAQVGQHSPWIQWADLVEANPEVVILMPCGYDLATTVRESHPLREHPAWPQLQAVQQGQVYVVDGNQYFNRPGPRLVDSLEILAEILHPDRAEARYRDRGWRSLADY
ncbi:MAG: cobalamin-binding protein [Leptolyngbyaceae cyanobacterium]